MRPFFLISAFSYTPSSAGVRALHLLCHHLRKMGEEAYVSLVGTTQTLDAPSITMRGIVERRKSGPLVVVYPEIIAGDKFGGDVVARWLLGNPGAAHFDVTRTWRTSDLLFYWLPHRKPSAPAERLDFDLVDHAIFNNEGNALDNEREGILIYNRRARKEGVPVTFEGFDIIANGEMRRRPFPQSQLAEMYRKSQALICYEITQTAIEAALCGCPVYHVISSYLPDVPQAYMPAARIEELTPDGIARARAELPAFAEAWRKHNEGDAERITRFADICKQRATSYRRAA